MPGVRRNRGKLFSLFARARWERVTFYRVFLAPDSDDMLVYLYLPKPIEGETAAAPEFCLFITGSPLWRTLKGLLSPGWRNKRDIFKNRSSRYRFRYRDAEGCLPESGIL